MACTFASAWADGVDTAPQWQWGRVADGNSAAGDIAIDNAVTSRRGCVWMSTFGTSADAQVVKYGSEPLFSVAETAAASVTANNLCVMSTDGDGNLRWQLHTLGADCSSGSGGVAATSDGGYVFGAAVRHADVEAMPRMQIIDGAGQIHDIDWTTSHRSYSLLVGKVDADGHLLWSRVYKVSTAPSPAASGATADFWASCLNLGSLRVDGDDNIYLAMNLRNTLSVPATSGEMVEIVPDNISTWSGDAQKSVGSFLLLSLYADGTYRNRLTLSGNAQSSYAQKLIVDGDRVYVQGYIIGNGNTLTVGDFTLAPSSVMSPLLICTDTDMRPLWAKCYPAEMVGGKQGFQNCAISVYDSTLWLTGMFNLAFGDTGDAAVRIASTQGAVREGFILKLDASTGEWLNACTSRAGHFNVPSAVANTGLTGYMGVISPSVISNRIYVYGYVMNATVGVFLREYDAQTLVPILDGGQYNVIGGGGIPTAQCMAYDASTGAVYLGARGNKAFAPLGGEVSAAPSAWGVYMSRFDLPKDVSTVAPTLEAEGDAEVEYYDLTGMRVKNPSHGIYIVRQGDRTYKITL